MTNFDMIFTFIIIFSLGLMAISCIQVFRLSRLSNTLEKIIDEVHTNRQIAIRDPNADFTLFSYPDVNATYKNLKWYTPWKSTDSMIVYNKES